MGIKIKFIIFFLIPLYCFSQDKLEGFTTKTARGYLYCKCINTEYNKLDSNGVSNKDYSLSYFLQMTNLSEQLQIKLDNYYTKNSTKYFSLPKEYTRTNTKANMISYSCWKFCESREVNNYLKKLFNKNQ